MAEDVRKVASDATAGAQPEAWVQKFSPLPMGTKIGDLLIQSVLGAGDLGITYVAVQEGRDRRVVLKEYFPRAIAFRDGPTVRVSAANTPNYTWGLDRFMSEARALAKVKHAALVTVQAVMEGNGTGYMVMAHEVGRDLNVWLHELKHVPTQDEIDRIAGPLVDGLAVLHNRETLHQEIIPANIIVRDNGTPVLVDFGSVRLGMRRRLKVPPPPDGRPYTAPEIMAGDQNLVGPSSDIYSLAGVLYFAVTGTPPAQADKRVLRDELVSAVQAAKGTYRPGFLEAIDAGLKFRPDDRPQHVTPWSEQLLAVEKPKAAQRVKPADAAPEQPPSENELAKRRLFEGDDSVPERQSEDGPAETLMENPSFRALFFGAGGAVAGGVVGALASVVIASIAFSTCVADSCIMPIMPYTAAVGALAGIYFGINYAKSSMPARASSLSIGDQ